MIVLLNGAFGIGKTVVARELVARLPDSLLFDPEKIGLALQVGGRLAGHSIADFQDLPSWRRLTVLSLRGARALRSNIIVPMAFSDRWRRADALPGACVRRRYRILGDPVRVDRT